MWRLIPSNTVVPTTRTFEAYNDLITSLPRAQRDNIPPKARQFLEGASNQRFTEAETVSEMHGLYSAMRADARRARSEGNFQTAHIADDIADAIMADIGGRAGDVRGPAGEAMRQAIDFSAEMNQTFRQGNVGRVLGYANPSARPLHRYVNNGERTRQKRVRAPAVKLAEQSPCAPWLTPCQMFADGRYWPDQVL